MKNFKKFTAFVLALCMVFSCPLLHLQREADEHTVYESAPEEEITVQFCRSCNQWHNSGQQYQMVAGFQRLAYHLRQRRSAGVLKAQTISRGRRSAIKSPRSGLRMWKRCLSQIWRTGSRAAST